MCNACAMPSNQPPTTIGSRDACQILHNIDRATLSRWVKDGKLPLAGKLPGKNGAMLFNREDVERLAELTAA